MQTLTTGQAHPVRRGRGTAAMFAALLVAGLGTAAWVGWHEGWIHIDLNLADEASPAPSPVSATTAAALAASANLAATDAALASASAKLTALEQRLAELNQQAIAASGQAGHAEALLLAFAVRRSIERGQPLGWMETQLRVRFGESQPNAVDRIVAAAQKPVTMAMLTEGFARLEPQLAGGPSNEGGWDWLMRQAGDLFVIRREDLPSPNPEQRLTRAREALAGGRVDAAVAEVERLPGRDAATEWLARAREWLMTQHALDQLESASLSFPPTPAVTAVAPAPAPLARPAAPATGLDAAAAPAGPAA